jgi:hypothetical protein
MVAMLRPVGGGSFWRRGLLVLFLGAAGRGLFAGAPASAEAVGAPALSPGEASETAELARNLRTARWMAAYDRVAWLTSDLLRKESKEVQAKVSPIWFCIENKRGWYAFYGRLLPTGHYDVAICYRQKAKDVFESVAAPAFPEMDRFAMAIDLTRPDSDAMTRSTTVRFNDYVRAVGDRIEVYYLPAFQEDGKLAYGMQYTYFLDAAGDKVTAREIHGSVLIGAFPYKQRAISLEMPECAVPTPQAIFTMMSYREAFADILSHCRDGYFGMATRNGEPVCVRTSAPSAPTSTPNPAGVQSVAPPGR